MLIQNNCIKFENVDDIEDVERLIPLVKRFLLDDISEWEGDLMRIVRSTTGIVVIYKNKNFKETVDESNF